MTVKDPFLKQHLFSNLGRFVVCYKTESIEDKERYCWADSIERGRREIYIRCLNCTRLFKLGNKAKTRDELLMIDRKKRVGPCLVCPYCHGHVWTALIGYEPGDVDDVFTENIDKVRKYEKMEPLPE